MRVVVCLLLGLLVPGCIQDYDDNCEDPQPFAILEGTVDPGDGTTFTTREAFRVPSGGPEYDYTYVITFHLKGDSRMGIFSGEAGGPIWTGDDDPWVWNKARGTLLNATEDGHGTFAFASAGGGTYRVALYAPPWRGDC